MDVLAKEAGVARATVYEHFRSKRAVLDALATTTARSVTLEPSRAPDGDPLRTLRDMLGDVCRHWSQHQTEMRELRTLNAMTGSDHFGEGVEAETLRKIVDELSRVGQLRSHWTSEDATDALSVLTSFSTYERLGRERAPEQVEGVLAKLAVSIITPGGPQPSGG
jgi:AcrR family transcriptional regulator